MEEETQETAVIDENEGTPEPYQIETTEEVQETNPEDTQAAISEESQEEVKESPKTPELSPEEQGALAHVNGLVTSIEKGDVGTFLQTSLGGYLEKEGLQIMPISKVEETEPEIDPIEEQTGSPALAQAFRELAGKVEALTSESTSNAQHNENKKASDALRAKYSDANDYIDGIGKVLAANPGISLDSAYKIASFDARPQAKNIRQLKFEKGGGPLRSGKPSAVSPPNRFKGKSVSDVFRMTQEELKFIK